MNLHSQFRSALQLLAYNQVKNDTDYKDYFDSWRLIQVTEPMKTKLGKAFDKDEISIANPKLQQHLNSSGTPNQRVAVWSFKNQKTALVPKEFVTVLEGEFSSTQLP